MNIMKDVQVDEVEYSLGDVIEYCGKFYLISYYAGKYSTPSLDGETFLCVPKESFKDIKVSLEKLSHVHYSKDTFHLELKRT